MMSLEERELGDMDQPTISNISTEDLQNLSFLKDNVPLYIEKMGEQRGQFDIPTLELFPVTSLEIRKVDGKPVLVLRSS